MNSKIVTRFAPSPTGLLHAGNYRTAVFAYLFARQNGGKFILRIEDTDRARSKPEYEANILESLAWLGLDFDEKYSQSANAPVHREYLEKMIASGHAYISKETPTKEGDRSEVIRFKNPNKKVVFNDLIRGNIEFDTTELKDFIIAKSLDEPVFHLAVVVDDFTEGVTHVIRGEDHISNTPRQILIQEAIGAPSPIYAHLPLVLAPDRSKLSKRKGALALTEYRDRGYLPATLLNFMAMLGWNPGTEEEIFTLDQLIEKFDLAKVQKSGAIFNDEKLLWYNREHLKKLSLAELTNIASERIPKLAELNSEQLAILVPVIFERLSTLKELDEMCETGEWNYLFTAPVVDKELLGNIEHLPTVISLLENIPADKFIPAKIKDAIWDFATENGRKEVLWPMRVALTGKEKSPDPFTVAAILGKEEVKSRIIVVIDLYK
ncbi:MAG: glutamate--tRNA ligase [Patescibacteria group bacterium]